MSLQIAWVALVTAGLLDVGWAIAMKYADGYTRLGWSVASLVLLAASVFLLGRALQVLEIGVAYTVWTGIGAVGTATRCVGSDGRCDSRSTRVIRRRRCWAKPPRLRTSRIFAAGLASTGH